jgi:hypothetical protein
MIDQKNSLGCSSYSRGMLGDNLLVELSQNAIFS